jgi:hypothetical protein
VCGYIDFRAGDGGEAAVAPGAVECGFDELVVPDYQKAFIHTCLARSVREDDEEVRALVGWCAEQEGILDCGGDMA